MATARFGKDGQRLAEDSLGPPVELLSGIAEPTIFCGEGVTRWIWVDPGASGNPGTAGYIVAGRSTLVAGPPWASRELTWTRPTIWRRCNPTIFGCRPLEDPSGGTISPSHRPGPALKASGIKS